jgi:mono/diheme cytochrome c family protein
MRTISGLVAATVLAALGVSGAAQDPDDDRAVARAAAERSVREDCLICHSAAMVERQRLTPPAWGSEVDKMIGWGAPVRPEEKDGLVAFLAMSYPADEPLSDALERIDAARVRALDRLPEPGRVESDAEAGSALYATHCASCHGAEAMGGDLGNNLVLNPALVDCAAYQRVVSEGRGKMPAFGAALTPGQSEQILAWLRARPLPEP